jgi:1-acyl-sn-glycerol-3-phosphate acyltransferase
MNRAAEILEAPMLEVLEELEAFLREARGSRALAALGPDASLERDLGLGSLERVELLSRLESRFRARAPERTLGEAETPRDLARAFRDAVEAPGERPGEGKNRPSSSPFAGRNPASESKSLPELLARWAQSAPDLPHVHLAEDGREETITYGDLYREALLVAGALRERGIRSGDSVAIMLGTSRGFFDAFMGALFAGAVPVPLYPPFSRSRIEEYARRQSAILENAKARILVTVREGRALGSVLRADAPVLREVVEIAELLELSRALDLPRMPGDAEEPALIQYTSGSTGDPKGVLLSHGNLLANMRAIGAAVKMGPADVGVSWLPLYHDMGLIGAWLTPMYFGFPVTILSPLAFLARPEKWLWTIHRKRGTISPAPNFAYELCARKIAEADLEGLDLSSWRAALNGAEPIAARSLDRFEKRFARCGFRRASFFPVYGLAESSLLLTAPILGEEPRTEDVDRDQFQREGLARPADRSDAEPLRFVSVGRPIPGHEIRIVAESGEELPERREGRLLFRGPSAMKAYLDNPTATAAITRPDGFLDSGDRAFVADGDVFITGREKDLIIKAGRNLLPQDIEAAAAEVAGVRAGSVVAFGVPDPSSGTERLVVVVETKEEAGTERVRIESEVERSVTDLVGVPPDEVLAVPPRVVPKTSSGKIRRGECRGRYLSGELSRRGNISSRTSARIAFHSGLSRLREVLERALRLGYGAYLYTVTAAFVLSGWALVLVGVSRRGLRKIVLHGSRIYLKLAFVPLRTRGLELFQEREGPLVLVANHAGYLDPLPLMAALDLDYAFAIKREAFSWPFLGRILRRLEHVPVDRKKVEESAQSADALGAVLSSGRSLVLFPEGTFTRATGLRPFKLGAFQLAAETGIPVVPVALQGTRRLLRDGTWIPRRVPIGVEVGEPLSVSPSFADVVRAKEETAEVLARLSGEPRLGS